MNIRLAAEYIGTLIGASITAFVVSLVGANLFQAFAAILGLSAAGNILIAYRIKPSERTKKLAWLLAVTFLIVGGLAFGVIRLG